MEIQQARFITSLAEYGPFVGRGMPQIALAGRSNVGKSSLINTLCRKKDLAKVSGTPGKTRLINIFEINESFHLIDLPGYGYAKVDKKEKDRWAEMINTYFASKNTCRSVLHLVDMRHPPSEEDIQMNRFLYQSGLNFRVIATKADKISKPKRQNALVPIASALAVQPWEILPFSAETGEGRAALLTLISKLLDLSSTEPT